MSFLNATLLAGVLAAAVPVVLHLLARQQPKRVVFPGVAFLTSRLTQQTSRLKIRRWWLLALRVLAVAALAVVLARPHINSAMAATWTTIGLVAVAALGLMAMASIALAKNLSRGLVWSLFIGSLLAAIGSGIGAITVLANSESPNIQQDQPLALAIVIDNSPTSAWTISTNDPETQNYLDRAIEQAESLIQRLPTGSRLSLIDRSPTPVGFSLDLMAARSRLQQFKPLAVPLPIADRIEAAIELVQTSDLPNRQVIVLTDLSEPTWNQTKPNRQPTSEDARLSSQLSSQLSTQLSADRRGDVQLSLLNLRGNVDEVAFNRSLSLPQVAQSAPAAGTAIPIRVEVTGSSSIPNSASTATVQLQLYANDPSLPVIRDGETILPPLRTVDRASVTLNPLGASEVVLSLPPLPLGTYHAVIELVGDDQFQWDNQRYLTIDLPQPPKVLVIGNDPGEVNVIATAMTAPNEINDPAASYAIETVAYRDLKAIDWQPFELLMMVDPPIRYDASQQQWIGSSEGLSSTMLDQLAEMVAEGAGLLLSLGPSCEVVGKANPTPQAASRTNSISQLTPQLKRVWRVPDPGTFLQVQDPTHPILLTLTQAASKPNWSDFRVRRYWQSEPGDWNVIATLAKRNEAAGDNRTQPPAILTRSFGEGRIAVTTTPLPATGPISRTWNDLFTSGDAWPAFQTVRGLASWLAGLEQTQTTVLAGQTVVLEGFGPPAESLSDPASERVVDGATAGNWQVYPPEGSPYPVLIQTSGEKATKLTLSNTTELGTYFFRSLTEKNDATEEAESKPVTGVSVNLAEAWSNNRMVESSVLATWFGDEPSKETWARQDDVEAVTLGSNKNSASAVSLHGPLMLFAVMMFIGEQLLSNYFYSREKRPTPSNILDRLKPEAS